MMFAAVAGHRSGRAAPSLRDAPQRQSMEIVGRETIYRNRNAVQTNPATSQSISKAIDNAINKASGTLRNLGWFEVAQMRGAIKDGKVQRYQVTLKVGFALE